MKKKEAMEEVLKKLDSIEGLLSDILDVLAPQQKPDDPQLLMEDTFQFKDEEPETSPEIDDNTWSR